MSAEPLILTTARFVNRYRFDKEKWSKVLAHTGGYEQFRYGEDHPSTWTTEVRRTHKTGYDYIDSPLQTAIICCPWTGILAIDVDDPELFTLTALGKLVSRADAYTTRGDHFHVIVDMRGVPVEKWPADGPVTTPDGVHCADIKSNGFIPKAGSMHYSGAPYTIGPDGMRRSL